MNLRQAASMNNLQIISIAVLWAFKRGCELFTETPETQLELSKKIPSGLIWKSQPYSYREVELQVKYTVKRLGFLCVGWQRGEGGWLRCVSLTVHRAQRGFVTGSWITGRLIWPWKWRWIFAWLLLQVPWTAGWDGCKKTPCGPWEANWGCATTGTQVCAQSPKPATNQPFQPPVVVWLGGLPIPLGPQCSGRLSSQCWARPCCGLPAAPTSPSEPSGQWGAARTAKGSALLLGLKQKPHNCYNSSSRTAC